MKKTEDDVTVLELAKMLERLKAGGTQKFKSLMSISNLDIKYKDRFVKMYNLCEDINGVTEYHGLTQAKTTRKKGQILELLLKSMIVHTGNIFESYENLGTSTNEIDLYLRVSEENRIFICNIIDPRFTNLLCECKNYQRPVDVTYIGKFYSLISASHKNIAILVSWNGIGGEGWNDGVGLVKKIYMLRENKQDKIYILDFNKKDFKRIIDGESLLSILNKKCEELDADISFEKYIDKHPNQDEFERKIDKILGA